MYKFVFEKLEVWQLARSLANNIYAICKRFPSREKYNLESQIKRATVSVMNNLAEGAARVNSKEQARFTEMAYASLMEVMNCAILAADQKFLDDSDLIQLREKVALLSTKLNRYRLSQLKRVG